MSTGADPEFRRLLRVYVEPQFLAAVEPRFDELGGRVGEELEALALAADRHPPVLRPRARNGAEVQRIEKHPAYRRLEEYAFSHYGLAAMSHRAGVFGCDGLLPPIVKYGLTFLFVQAEFGVCCPLSMTDALTRTLRRFGSEALIERYLEPLTSQDFDSLLQGAMFMTEQDAGSDVGAITTEACRENGVWRLYGEKWFCSNADADLAMVLARAQGAEPGTRGLTLFLLPRRLEDGSLNRYRIVRLKDKLGTRSMASGEVVLEGAEAHVVGEQDRSFKPMTDMINMSRLSNGVRSAGLMRRAVNETLFVARNRSAFGRRLVDLALMQRQLVKMLVTAEQGRSMVFHTARCLEQADASPAIGWSFTVNHATLVPEGIDGFLETLPLERLGEVRLADNNGEYEVHLFPGEGIIDFEALFARLHALGYAGPYTVAFGSLKDMLRGREQLARGHSR
jgi:acyl-CoA dehydrogenase